jgi:alkanesulfonate monooxygenase SsuD/methylene tetrahydromethanopterin reductase-like flavin-dependent oxidoreductase (luciferase family)
VVIGETPEQVEDLSAIVRVGVYRLLAGEMGPSPTVEDAKKVEIPAHMEMRMGGMLTNQFAGTVDAVARELKAFADETHADELMLTSWIPFEENRAYVLREFKRAWDAIDV